MLTSSFTSRSWRGFPTDPNNIGKGKKAKTFLRSPIRGGSEALNPREGFFGVGWGIEVVRSG